MSKTFILTGILTTHREVKLGSAQISTGLEKWMEPMAVISSLLGGTYPQELLAYVWKKQIRNSFHDCIYGAHVDAVTPDIMTDYKRAVLQHLGRYTHRIAISNERILKLEDGMVTFSWLDYRDSQKKIMVFPVHEFIRRMLLHVLPYRFMRIRHYGLLASCHRGEKLKRYLRLAGYVQAKARFLDLTAMEILTIVLGRDATLCPCCGKAPMCVTHRFDPGHARPDCAYLQRFHQARWGRGGALCAKLAEPTVFRRRHP